MSKVITLNNFAKSGLNSDLMPWDLSGDYVTEISNIRINRGKLSPFGGNSLWATLPVDFNTGYLLNIGSGAIKYWVICGDTGVYQFDGDVFTDISNTDGYAITDEDLWSGCRLSDIAIINNISHYPEWWNSNNPASTLQYLSWDATQNWKEADKRAHIIRSHKQFLFALDLVEGGVEIKDGVRWSAPADVNGIPPTWDELDTTNFAGLVNLGGDGGRIIDGLSLRDAFVVYREYGISIFDYVGGSFVWQIRHLSTTVGLISPDTIAEVKGRHFILADGDIIVNDGNSIESLLHNRIKRKFLSDFDKDNYDKSFVIRNNTQSEIWFCIAKAGALYPNVAYIYNWRDDTWSIRDIPQTPHGSYGTQASPPIEWDNSNLTWEEGVTSWNQETITPLDETIVIATKPSGAGLSGELLFLDFSTNNSVSSFSSVIERTGFALEGKDNVTTITRVYPRSRGSGSFYVELGSQDYPDAPVRWKDKVLFNPATDRKIDMRTTGELHCFRFSTTDDNIYWELSGIDVEYVNAGRR